MTPLSVQWVISSRKVDYFGVFSRVDVYSVQCKACVHDMDKVSPVNVCPQQKKNSHQDTGYIVRRGIGETCHRHTTKNYFLSYPIISLIYVVSYTCQLYNDICQADPKAVRLKPLSDASAFMRKPRLVTSWS
jgi:hypothetical protein